MVADDLPLAFPPVSEPKLQTFIMARSISFSIVEEDYWMVLYVILSHYLTILHNKESPCGSAYGYPVPKLLHKKRQRPTVHQPGAVAWDRKTLHPSMLHL